MKKKVFTVVSTLALCSGTNTKHGIKEKRNACNAAATGLRVVIEGVADDSVNELEPERYEETPDTSYQPEI